MKEAMEGVAKQPQITYMSQPGVTSALFSQLSWLLGTAAGFAQKTLSKADVAAVFLSRKILLDRVSLQGKILSTLVNLNLYLAASARTCQNICIKPDIHDIIPPSSPLTKLLSLIF